MKSVNKLLSLIIAVAIVLSSLPFAVSFGTVASAASVQSDPSLVINRPTATVNVTEVTRVAFSEYSMKQPSGSNSVIVKATPSGMPELRGSFNHIAYADETPVATQIAFTPGVSLSSVPTITCSNTTVTFDGYYYSNGTYTWYVTGGTATVGTTLIFTVSYTYTDTNAATGKQYTNTYTSQGVSYVEAIATPSGEYSTKRTYEDFFFGQSTKNRSYVASYILGANTYGTLYANGAGEGSVYFESTNSSPGWTTDYGMMHRSDGHSASRDYNIGYDPDGNRPISYVYFDRSLHSTLSDLNLRLVTSNLDEAGNSNERVTVYHKASYINYGVTDTFDGESDDGDPPANSMAASELGLTSYSGSIYGPGAYFNMYFTGSGPSSAVGTYDYTIAVRYRTPADWSEVFVGHSHSLRVITYDKGALRTLVESIQNTDPTVMTTDIESGGFKGYNPQSWYYSSGWENFLNAFNAAKSCLNRPNTSQTEIDQQYTTLLSAYNALEMRVADYSIAKAYYNQAMAKNKNNYTLASWAKVQNLIDAYVSNYSSIYQPAVDKYAADLKFALDSLQEANADYTAFNKHLNTVNTLMRKSETSYGMPASQAYNNWSNLVSTLTKSGCVYDELDGYIVAEPLLISDQSTVDGYVLALERAINALSLKSADYSEAGKAESAYKIINLSQVVTEIATELTAAYDALVALHNKDLSYQTAINEATANLNYWLSRVQYKPADITEALSVIAVANSLDRTIYGDMSAVDQAVANLESKLDLDIRYQSDINRAVIALQSAIDNLGKNIADYTSVYDAIALVQEHEELILSTYEDTYGFTVDTFYSNWSAVVTAINNVEYGLDFTQQTTVDGFADAILLAFNSLKENTADYTRVKELQDEAYTIVTTGDKLYTAASLDNLTAVYVNVVANRPISEQAIVDGYAESIQTAIEDLDYLPADYAQVNAQLALAQEALDRDEAFGIAHPGYTYYTAESVSDLNVAIVSVVDGLDIRYQSEVDGYVTTISAALAELDYAPADYTQVDLKLLDIPDDLSLYTTLSVATLNATVNNINRTYTADKQATVDRYVTTIDNAIKGLKFKAGDYAAVTAALKKVPADSSIYTDDSWNHLQEQIGAVVYGLDITHQDEIDTYALAIEQAVEFLRYKTADYTAVNDAIANANTEIEKGIYTDDSVALVQQAIDAVEIDYPITRQTEVDAFAAAINDAVSKLTKKDADYTTVYEAKQAAEDKINTGWYTDDTVDALNQVLSTVEYGLTVERQSDVDAYAQAIVDATGKLVLKSADYSEIELLKEAAEIAINEGVYTEWSIENLQKAIDAVEYGYTIDRQSEVDAFAVEISTALNNLSLLPADFTKVREEIDKAWAKINEGIYTDDSVNRLVESIRSAESVMENGGFTIKDQDVVDSLYYSVKGEAENLIIKDADYTAVENAKAAATEKIETGLYTDESVALLQAEIDKVVYGLDITYQSVVQQYADNIVNLTNELELKLANYTELQKILDLLDNSSSEIYTNTYKNFNEVMSLIGSYRENTVSQNMALTIDKQSQVDEMAATLQGYIDMLEPEEVYVERFEPNDTAVFKTQGGVKYIWGLQPRLLKATFQNKYVTYENVKLEYNMTTSRYLGTGSTVTVKSAKTGEVIDTYVIVIYGDLDGSATIDKADSKILMKYLAGTSSGLTAVQKIAANVEGRTVINSGDQTFLDQAVTGKRVIDQVTGKAVLA